ncbi:glycosyl hydrolase catalytic core-domain-containing protein [Mycena albidolilacea]|uniref:Glycosyl hydrolase catalytic core-domain-containing protein n=1 Tax=Mycena albidolilacea TaxID=1033008 RepID=A0AAD7AUE2_9AGAR|nr:glycosyl hydrolase catalytic core-domain-containing protein [Mycena albidolilacea]
MAPTSLLSIVSLALLTLFASSVTSPVNALSIQSDHVVRRHADISHSKRSLKAKKRSNSKRCQAKASSSLSSSKAKATPTTKAAVVATSTHTTTAAAKTTAASSGSSSGSSGSSSGSSSSSSSGSVNLRGKACLAWPNYNYNKLSSWKGSNTGLIYSWDATKVPGAADLGMTYAPMLWGWKNAEDFKAKTVEGYANIALGMNEPNEEGQSNMDAYSGINLWKQYMLPLADKGYTLISPAMSSRPNGKDWVKTFMDNCGDCKVSGIATHWYGTDLEEFKSYVSYWHDTYNLPVYVTEYADQDFNGGPQASMDEIWAFMTGATSWLNSQDWVKAHCWFGAMEGMTNVNPLNKLMNDAGDAPNDLGYYFINN